MRQWINLFENMQVQTKEYFVHVTPYKNIKSILKQGLIPNQNGGNYTDTRWISLKGVYASKNMDHLLGYLRSHGMVNFGIIVIETSSEDTLPDEDIIDPLLTKATHDVFKRHGYQVSPEFDPAEEEIEYDDPIWNEVAKEFDKLAGGKGTTDDTLIELVEYWKDFAFYLGGDIDPDYWLDIKDAITRKYRKMKAPLLDYQHSIRIPNAVGFEGFTKIIFVGGYKNNEFSVFLDKAPAEAEREISKFVSDLTACVRPYKVTGSPIRKK